MFCGILWVSNESLNGKVECRAYNDGYYEDPVLDGVHSLTQLRFLEFGNSNFTISEIEVWEVTFE